VLNPGSVGLGYAHGQDPDVVHFDPWAAWAVVWTDGGRLSIDFRRTPFHAQAVADAHLASGMPYGEEYARAWRAEASRPGATLPTRPRSSVDRAAEP
jgi:hypothetical protein